jgi:hypothetical protein
VWIAALQRLKRTLRDSIRPTSLWAAFADGFRKLAFILSAPQQWQCITESDGLSNLDYLEDVDATESWILEEISTILIDTNQEAC